ncbi:hypothetical protein SNE40_008139 [Patella caerulea]|uniref:Uncharacterized protein n=1 Tax=Patella caerulea TaxID=87958 RepID=A0AAN8JZ59_PATCE
MKTMYCVVLLVVVMLAVTTTNAAECQGEENGCPLVPDAVCRFECDTVNGQQSCNNNWYKDDIQVGCWAF